MVLPAPGSRLRTLSSAPVDPHGEYVLYWMHAARRAGSSFALDHAIVLAQELYKPVLVLEALDLQAPFASRRTHAFLTQGMESNRRAFGRAGVAYHPYVERRPGQARGLVRSFAARACAVLTDRSPFPFLRARVERLASLPVRTVEVDGWGLLPVSTLERPHKVAWGFRRFLQRELPRHPRRPHATPLRGLKLPPVRVPEELLRRYPAWSGGLEGLPVDQAVRAVALRGGELAGRARLRLWLEEGLPRYEADRAHPDRSAGSGLSPWLHFGHLSAFEVVDAVKARGAHEGFLDQLVTWRELGAALVETTSAPWSYGSLPDWARRTLDEHRHDPREALYSLQQLEQARTHDPLWNAAQRQLLEEGVIHNSLRMLWGKRVIAWSPSPEEAWERLFHLNDTGPSTVATPTPSRASRGASVASTGPGDPKVRSSARCAP